MSLVPLLARGACQEAMERRHWVTWCSNLSVIAVSELSEAEEYEITARAMSTEFEVTASFQGSLKPVHATTSTTVADLVQLIRDSFELTDSALKLLYRGKNLVQQDPSTILFPKPPSGRPPKILVMASADTVVTEIQNKKSDPLMRGFDNETKHSAAVALDPFWGTAAPDKKYRFVRLEVCKSFIQGASDTPPHMFEAQRLLEKLATDPGVVAVLRERELVVNTLGEMDPVDDRLMQKTEAKGGCLLGYNTNHGLRIDVRLRSNDLQSFYPYRKIVGTLIHELSHNWISEHNLYFWANFGQMRAEYLHSHYVARSMTIWQGQTSAQIADLPPLKGQAKEQIEGMVLNELLPDMAQHGLHPRQIASAVGDRCRELDEKNSDGGTKLGSSGTSKSNKSARDFAAEAAERRMNGSSTNK